VYLFQYVEHTKLALNWILDYFSQESTLESTCFCEESTFCQLHTSQPRSFLTAHSCQLIADKRNQQACARNETTKVASAASDKVGGLRTFSASARFLGSGVKADIQLALKA
jgi:hypothetical protein